MTPVVRVVEELVEHLQVVSVGASHLKLAIGHVLSHRLYPSFVLVVAGHVEQDLFFFHGALGILVGTLLQFESVQLLVL